MFEGCTVTLVVAPVAPSATRKAMTANGLICIFIPRPGFAPCGEGPFGRFEVTAVVLMKELDEAIRRSESEGVRCGIATMERLHPDRGATSIEVAGGLAVFTGIDSPLSQSYGVGSSTPVTEGDVSRITDLYESRGATPRVFVTPLADPSLAPALVCAGYVPSEYENVLASDAFNEFCSTRRSN